MKTPPPTKRLVPGRMSEVSGKGWLEHYRRPKFSAVTVRSMDTGEIIRTEAAYTKKKGQSK